MIACNLISGGRDPSDLFFLSTSLKVVRSEEPSGTSEGWYTSVYIISNTISRTLPGVTSVLVLFLLVLFLFAMMFYKLFQNKGFTKANGQPYFSVKKQSLNQIKKMRQKKQRFFSDLCRFLLGPVYSGHHGQQSRHHDACLQQPGIL